LKIVHGSPGFGSIFSEDQTKDFLSKGRLNLLLGTIDDKGDPNVHPVWYLYENGKLYIETSKTAKKANNARSRSTVYFCIDDETMPYKGVRGKGIIKILDDPKKNIPIAEKIMIKYTGNLENEVAKFLMDGVKNGLSILLEITPKYFATWDHSTGLIEPKDSS
jgi:nitroimidazol reductase NimA-like FMN-containing flavoprotein (pyridoxamine 5'-phosphate oxidase superfamily)